MEKYDSTEDTQNHIKSVRHFMSIAILNLSERAKVHDASKLQSPEKEIFDEVKPKLKKLTYNSPEYNAAKDEAKPAVQHHYENNTHHPEHYENGIDGMSLLDLIEMFCDWQAASLEQFDGSMEKSIKSNKERFKMSDQLHSIFENTLKELW